MRIFRTNPHTQTWNERSFRRLLACERDLVDRRGGACALLVLDTSRANRVERTAFRRFLNSEARISDSVGHFRGDLAVLMRRTQPEGAEVFIRRIGEWLGVRGIEVGHQLLCYPDAEGGGGRELGPRSLELAVPPPIESRPDSDDGRVAISAFEACLVDELSPGRRAIDVLVSGAALLGLAPLMAAVAVAMRLDSPGPVFYKQQRVGAGGRIFEFFKFRSMRADADRDQAGLANEKDGPIFKMRNDPRVTRVGRIIRRYSLDELPQLWNVLRGDMTLVGPRPQKPDEVVHYEPWQRRRLGLPGGLTCTWQVSGRSDVSFREWMRMDCAYASRRDAWTDLALLARTVPALVTAKGAY